MRDFLDNAGFLATTVDDAISGVHGAIVWVFAGEPTRNEVSLGPRILVVVGGSLEVESLARAVAVRLSRPPTRSGRRTASSCETPGRDLRRREW
jgi:hypothetical protein